MTLNWYSIWVFNGISIPVINIDKPEFYPKSSRAKAMAFSMGRDQIEHRQLLVEPPL
jgi:hypothetical protein